MATKTEIYELRKKEENDFYNIEDFNNNMDTLEKALTEFDDSGTAEGVTSFPEMLTKLVTGNKLAITLKNLKAGLQFVLHAGSIVNNCVTDNANLPVSAAMAKSLQDQINQANSNLSNKADKTSLSSYALKSDLNNIVTSENINPISFTAGETKTLIVKTNCNDYVPFIVRERKSGKPLVVTNFWLDENNVSKIILYAPLSITNVNIDIYFIKRYWQLFIVK